MIQTVRGTRDFLSVTAADRPRSHCALVAGEDGVAVGKYGLKNLATGEPESLALEEIISKMATEAQRHRGGEQER